MKLAGLSATWAGPPPPPERSGLEHNGGFEAPWTDIWRRWRGDDRADAAQRPGGPASSAWADVSRSATSTVSAPRPTIALPSERPRRGWQIRHGRCGGSTSGARGPGHRAICATVSREAHTFFMPDFFYARGTGPVVPERTRDPERVNTCGRRTTNRRSSQQFFLGLTWHCGLASRGGEPQPGAGIKR